MMSREFEQRRENGPAMTAVPEWYETVDTAFENAPEARDEAFAAVNELHGNWHKFTADADSPASLFSRTILQQLHAEHIASRLPALSSREVAATEAAMKNGATLEFLLVVQDTFAGICEADPNGEITPISASRYARAQAAQLTELLTLDDSRPFTEAAFRSYLATVMSRGKGTALRMQKAYGETLDAYAANDLSHQLMMDDWQTLRRRAAESPEIARKVRILPQLVLLRELRGILRAEGNDETLLAENAVHLTDFARRAPLNAAIMEQLQPKLPEIEQLDFEVLPPGDLQTFAEEIVASRRHEHKRPTIDLGRLQILKNLREWWEEAQGADTARYAKGMRTSRRTVHEAGVEQPDEYILLVLEQRLTDGTTVEHVVAESPVAGENALYVQRYDTNHWDWRELMRHPKQDITEMGARALHHRAPENTDLVTVMTEKAKYFLTCPETEFLEGRLSGVEKDGTPRIRLPRNVTRHLVADARQAYAGE